MLTIHHSLTSPRSLQSSEKVIDIRHGRMGSKDLIVGNTCCAAGKIGRMRAIGFAPSPTVVTAFELTFNIVSH